MNEHKTLAISLVSLFLFSGCLGAVDPAVEVPDIELPDDWGATVARTVSSPHLSQFSDCDELENALKISLEEEARTQILQAIEEQHFYGGVWLDGDMGAEMAMDDAATTGATSAPQTKRTEGTDYSGTNNQEQGVDEADFVKTDGHNILLPQWQKFSYFRRPRIR